MKIKNLFSGIVTNERVDIARALIRQGMAEALEPDTGDTPARPTHKPGSVGAPSWEVGTYELPVTGGHELRVVMKILGQTYYYNGKPEDANARVTWDGGSRYLSGLGREIPATILDEYRRQYKSNSNIRGVSPMYGADAAKAFSGAANQRMAEKKEFFDKQVKGGTVPYIAPTVLDTPQD